MPCRSDYMEPRAREEGSREEAKLIVFVNERLNRNTESYIVKAADSYYGDEARADTITATLCSLIGGLTEAEKNEIVYDGHNETARRLADWWDAHQKADAKREAADAAAEAARQQAQALLTATRKLRQLGGRTGPDGNTVTLTAEEQNALLDAVAKVTA